MATIPGAILSKDITKSAFNRVTPETWAHRIVPMDDDDGFVHLRPVMALSANLINTFKSVYPNFQYKAKYTPPKRILTNPSIPRHNEGNDNENYDLIMHVGDVLGSATSRAECVLLEEELALYLDRYAWPRYLWPSR